MTYDADQRDLARHEAEIAAGETFNYAVLDEPESELLGCVYIDPPDAQSPPGSDAVCRRGGLERGRRAGDRPQFGRHPPRPRTGGSSR